MPRQVIFLSLIFFRFLAMRGDISGNFFAGVTVQYRQYSMSETPRACERRFAINKSYAHTPPLISISGTVWRPRGLSGSWGMCGATLACSEMPVTMFVSGQADALGWE